MILIIESSAGTICALKVQEPPAKPLISDKSISNIKKIASKISKMDIKDKISTIKNSVPEFNNTYRTYNPSKLKIIQKFPIT